MPASPTGSVTSTHSDQTKRLATRTKHFSAGSQASSAIGTSASCSRLERTTMSSLSSQRSLRRSPISAVAHALDLGAAGGELLLEIFVAAVEVVDAVDEGLTLGRQRRQHQRRGGTQIGRHHLGAE